MNSSHCTALDGHLLLKSQKNWLPFFIYLLLYEIFIIVIGEIQINIKYRWLTLAVVEENVQILRHWCHQSDLDTKTSYSHFTFYSGHILNRTSTCIKGVDLLRVLTPWKHVGGSEYVLTPQNVAFFHSKLLLDNSASFISSRMKDLCQSEMEGKTNFSRHLKQFDGLTWLTPTQFFYDRSLLLHNHACLAE